MLGDGCENLVIITTTAVKKAGSFAAGEDCRGVGGNKLRGSLAALGVDEGVDLLQPSRLRADISHLGGRTVPASFNCGSARRRGWWASYSIGLLGPGF